MKKIIFIITIVTITVVSYIFSSELNTFYIKTFYMFRHKNEAKVIERAKKLYNHKKHIKLHNYLEKMLILHPHSSDIKQFYGFNAIALGKYRTGVSYILSSTNKGNLSSTMIEKALDILFKHKLYGDVAHTCHNYSVSGGKSYYYCGVAFYKRKKYKTSIKWFEKAWKRGIRTSGLCLYLGKSFEAVNELKAAEKILLFGRSRNPRNINLKRALVNIYRKQKKFEKAHKMMKEL